MASSGSESHKDHDAAGDPTADRANYTSQAASEGKGPTEVGEPLAAAGPLAASDSVSEQRPASLTPAVEDAIVRAVALGQQPHRAATVAGIPPRTWEQWIAIANGTTRRWPDGSSISPALQGFLTRLAGRIARAQAEYEAQQVQNILQDAETVNERTGTRDWRARAWLLEHLPAFKRDYAEYRELKVEQQGTVSHEHRMVQQLPESEVIELAGPEFAALLEPPAAGKQA